MRPEGFCPGRWGIGGPRRSRSETLILADGACVFPSTRGQGRGHWAPRADSERPGISRRLVLQGRRAGRQAPRRVRGPCGTSTGSARSGVCFPSLPWRVASARRFTGYTLACTSGGQESTGRLRGYSHGVHRARSFWNPAFLVSPLEPAPCDLGGRPLCVLSACASCGSDRVLFSPPRG